MQERRRKIYTSFHDLSPREYMYFPKGTLEVGKPGKFSITEIKHLLIAMGVLTLAFSFVFSPIYAFDLDGFLRALPFSFLGILTAFIVHELSHKFIAQKYGLWAEFRMYTKGLLLSLFLAVFIGFVIAVPGAVMFRGEIRPFEMGKIAAAGPSANIVAAAVTFPLRSFTSTIYLGSINLGQIMFFISMINALLATFNLLPFGPMDGNKVIRWNGIVWSLLLSSAIILLILNFQGGLVLPGF